MHLSQNPPKYTNRLSCILLTGERKMSLIWNSGLKFDRPRVHEYLKQMNEEVLSSTPSRVHYVVLLTTVTGRA